MVFIQLYDGTTFLSNYQVPALANASDLDIIDDVFVEAQFNPQTNNCEGYFVAFSAITNGESYVETHVMFFDPSLVLQWHKIPFDNLAQQVIVRDCYISDVGIFAELLIELDYQQGLHATIQLPTPYSTSTPIGDVVFSRAFEITNNGQTVTNPTAFVRSPGSILGSTAVVGRSYDQTFVLFHTCLLYTSPSPRDQRGSRMPSSA